MQKVSRLRHYRWTLLVGLVVLRATSPHLAAEGQMTFDVASVKLSAPIPDLRLADCKGGPGTADPGLFTCNNMSLKNFIQIAYNVAYAQISGPDWLSTGEFDINAKIPPGSTREQFRTMLQTLLIERFRLKVRLDKKDVDGFDLVVGKAGLKIKPSRDEGPAGPRITTTGVQPLVATAKKQKIAALARNLTGLLGQPVEDQTGETDEYDFVLEFTNPSFMNSDKVTTPSIFTALQETLGLSLKPRKITVNSLFVESADKTPAAN